MYIFNKELVSIFVAILLMFGTNITAAKSKTRLKLIDFNEFSIDLTLKLLQPIIVVDLLPDTGKELLTIGIDDDKKRWIVLYNFDNETQSYSEHNRIIIPKQFHSFDVTKYKKGHLQNLYLMSSHSLAKYEIDATAKERFKSIAEIHSIILKNDYDDIQRGNFIKDFNNDDFDDVIVTDFYNIHLLIGQSDGTMKAQSLPIEPKVDVYSKSVSYSQTKLYFNDINFDQKVDIIKIAEGEMEIFHQLQDGLFEIIPTKLAINDTINREEEQREVGEVSIRTGSAFNRELEDLIDLNADDITDMVVLYTTKSGLFDIENNYEIYLGKNIDGKLVYADTPDSVVKAEGTLMGLKFVDIDQDDKSEILTAGFEIGVFKIIDILLTGDIDVGVYLFKMDAQGKFRSRPVVSKEVELSFSLSSGQGSIPMFELADLNGDGLKDLVLSNSEKELKIYYGEKTKKIFSKRGLKYKTQLPKNGQMVLVGDLNDDGKDDLLFKLSEQDGNTTGRKIKILFSL